MANVQISDLTPATLPIDAATTFFEIQTVEGGIDVSRKIAAQDLGVGGATLPIPTTAFNTLRVNAAGTAWEENGDLTILATQVAIQNGMNLRVRTGGQFIINTTDDAAGALVITPPASPGGGTQLDFTGNANIDADAAAAVNLQTGGASRVQVDGATQRLVFNDFPIFIEERAAAGGDVAGFGQLFVRNDTPNVLVFRDDAGGETVLGSGGGVTFPIQAADNDEIQFGTGNLFQLVHDGSEMFLRRTTAQTFPVVVESSTNGTGPILELRQTVMSPECRLWFTNNNSNLGFNIAFTPASGNLLFYTGNDSLAQQELLMSMNRNSGVSIYSDGSTLRVQTRTEGTQFTAPIYLIEQAAQGSVLTANGQLWVRNDAPNVLVFTDDAGTDFDVAGSGVPAGFDPTSNQVISGAWEFTNVGGLELGPSCELDCRNTADDSTTFIQNLGSSFQFGVAGADFGTQIFDISQSSFAKVNCPPLFIGEQAAGEANVAGDGQLWVRNDAPSTLMYQDDAGNDYTIPAEYDTQTTDDTVNNTIVLAATQIQFANIPSGIYRIDGLILLRDVAVSGCGARLQMTITGAGSNTWMRIANKNFAGAGAPTYDEIGLATDLFDGIALVTGSGTSRMGVTGVVDFVSGTNTFEVEFSQNVATVGDLDFEAGSWIALTKLANS